MDKVNSRIAQAYGYAVCLICVIVILVSAHSVINSAFDFANPGSAGNYGFGPIQPNESVEIRHGSNGSLDTVTTSRQPQAELISARQRNEGATKYRALRSLVSDFILLILAAAIFARTWKWIRRSDSEPTLP